MVDDVRVIAAKKEVTYGTDAAPTLAANAILTRNYNAVPVEVDQIQRNLDSGAYGATAGKPSNARTRSTYEVELAGSGAAGTAPKWMVLLEACGLAPPVLVAAASATQKFAKPGEGATSLSEYNWVGGNQRRKAIGQRGTFSLDATAGQTPFIGLDMTGLIPAVAPRDVNVADAADMTGWQEPQEVNNENSTFTIGGYAALMRSLSITAAVNVNLRSLVGARYIKRGNHGSSMRLVIEAPDLGTKDYLQTLQTGALVPWQFVHGKTAGNIVELSGAKAQITAIGESDEDDVLMFTIDVSLTVDGGADDLVIVAK